MSDEEQYVIPQEEVLEQRVIAFMGDDLIAALTATGIYITLPGMCRAMSLKTQSQLQRILNTNRLRMRLRQLTLKTRGGMQKVNCLNADFVALWLGGIETAKAKPEFQEKIDLYHEKLAPKANEIFRDVMGLTTVIDATPSTNLTAVTPLVPTELVQQYMALREQYVELVDVVNLMREGLDVLAVELGGKLEQTVDLLQQIVNMQHDQQHNIQRLEAKTQGLTKAQKAKVSHAVGIIARDSAMAGTPLDYRQVYGALIRRFTVASYSDIPDTRYAEVMTYLRELWQTATSGTLPEQGNLFT